MSLTCSAVKTVSVVEMQLILHSKPGSQLSLLNYLNSVSWLGPQCSSLVGQLCTLTLKNTVYICCLTKNGAFYSQVLVSQVFSTPKRRKRTLINLALTSNLLLYIKKKSKIYSTGICKLILNKVPIRRLKETKVKKLLRIWCLLWWQRRRLRILFSDQGKY